MSSSQLLDLFLSSSGICTDTRTLKPGQLFIALKGENFNGNKFARKALELGARAVIIDEPEARLEGAYLVEDGLKALQSLAREYRKTLTSPVIALTGSNGKTTTKELVHAALSVQYKVHATAGNLNNHIGVPLTLLSTPRDTEILVVEMGANHIGEIRDLCEIALPDYGLITNIGRAHLEGFGSIEGVVKGKTEMYRHILKSGRLVFYNKADKILFNQLPAGIKTVPYRTDLSFSSKALYLNFTLEEGQMYQSHLSGDYNQLNISAALTISKYFGIEDTVAAEAIASYAPKINRSEIQVINGCSLIMDAYNANPTSMQAAINSLSNLKTDKKKNLILGDMKELGEESVALHTEILDLISETNWSSVVLIGPDFSKAAAKQSKIAVKTYISTDACIADFLNIRNQIQGGITLIKASRSLKLESLKDLI